MSWEKIGITITAKPTGTSGGLYVRIPKKTADAYELWTADVLEVRLERALRRVAGASITGPHINSSLGVSARKSDQNKGSEPVVSTSPRRSRRGAP